MLLIRREMSKSLRQKNRERVDVELEEGVDKQQQCECKSCLMERKYERKRRKKSEKITWN